MTVATKQSVKKAFKKILKPVDNALSACIEKCSLAMWYEEKIYNKWYATDGVQSQEDLGEVDWKRDLKVAHSGVCVLSIGKLLMCRPLKTYQQNYQRNPDCRRAIVLTKNYRPMKYPGAISLLASLAFIRKNVGSWLKKEGHGNLTGNVALLDNREFDNDNYYHFWVDAIADIWYIRQHVPKAELPDYYLVPLSNAAWQRDVLSLCGIQQHQVIPYARYEVVAFDRLILTVRDKGPVNLPPWLTRAIHEMCDWVPRAQKGERLIFVSRADADRRRVANESAIRDRLVEKGFEVHTLNGLSIKEQQQLFASAAIICAPHGASLTNIVWCGPGTVIIEFLSERHLNPCFFELAKQNRLLYYPYVCSQLEGVTNGVNGDIAVSDTQIESVLDIVARNSQQQDNMDISMNKCKT